MPGVDTETPTVTELLDQASERLDALASEFAARARPLPDGWVALPTDAALFELWRTVAHIHAAVRILADERTPTATTPKAV